MEQHIAEVIADRVAESEDEAVERPRYVPQQQRFFPWKTRPENCL